MAVSGRPPSRPTGIATLNDIIWYSDFRAARTRWCASTRRPKRSRRGRFPPTGVVRNMMPTSEGDLVLACRRRRSSRLGRSAAEVKSRVTYFSQVGKRN